jgi:hypothetical protein
MHLYGPGLHVLLLEAPRDAGALEEMQPEVKQGQHL